MFKRCIASLVLISFFGTTISPQEIWARNTMPSLPVPGEMVRLSSSYEPVLIKGLTVNKDNPFLFDFVVDTGHSALSAKDADLKDQADRLIKYFFACLTIPEKDLWVNLSPYEKDRIAPQALKETALGRDLLAQDYMLKQITASLIYPEKDLGKEFWNRIYAKAQALYGTSEIPVNTFNKVWILADQATVYEHGQTAFVVKGHLKVMLEEDYVAREKHSSPAPTIVSQIVRDLILPELEREVNEGKNFAPLRQIFNSLILATWYKKNLKSALLNQVYTDKNTVKGLNDVGAVINRPEEIYQQYLKAYKKGVFNFIKEDQVNGQTIPRKYFSGGFGVDADMLQVSHDPAMAAQVETTGTMFQVKAVTDTTRNSLVVSKVGYRALEVNGKQVPWVGMGAHANVFGPIEINGKKAAIRLLHQEVSREAIAKIREGFILGKENEVSPDYIADGSTTDSITAGELPWIAVEWTDAVPLDRIFKLTDFAWTEKQKNAIRDFLRSLNSKKIYLKDMTPSNIGLIEEDGRITVVIIDAEDLTSEHKRPLPIMASFWEDVGLGDVYQEVYGPVDDESEPQLIDDAMTTEDLAATFNNRKILVLQGKPEKDKPMPIRDALQAYGAVVKELTEDDNFFRLLQGGEYEGVIIDGSRYSNKEVAAYVADFLTIAHHKRPKIIIWGDVALKDRLAEPEIAFKIKEGGAAVLLEEFSHQFEEQSTGKKGGQEDNIGERERRSLEEEINKLIRQLTGAQTHQVGLIMKQGVDNVEIDRNVNPVQIIIYFDPQKYNQWSLLERKILPALAELNIHVERAAGWSVFKQSLTNMLRRNAGGASGNQRASRVSRNKTREYKDEQRQINLAIGIAETLDDLRGLQNRIESSVVLDQRAQGELLETLILRAGLVGVSLDLAMSAMDFRLWMSHHRVESSIVAVILSMGVVLGLNALGKGLFGISFPYNEPFIYGLGGALGVSFAVGLNIGLGKKNDAVLSANERAITKRHVLPSGYSVDIKVVYHDEAGKNRTDFVILGRNVPGVDRNYRFSVRGDRRTASPRLIFANRHRADSAMLAFSPYWIAGGVAASLGAATWVRWYLRNKIPDDFENSAYQYGKKLMQDLPPYDSGLIHAQQKFREATSNVIAMKRKSAMVITQMRRDLLSPISVMFLDKNSDPEQVRVVNQIEREVQRMINQSYGVVVLNDFIDHWGKSKTAFAAAQRDLGKVLHDFKEGITNEYLAGLLERMLLRNVAMDPVAMEGMFQEDKIWQFRENLKNDIKWLDNVLNILSTLDKKFDAEMAEKEPDAEIPIEARIVTGFMASKEFSESILPLFARIKSKYTVLRGILNEALQLELNPNAAMMVTTDAAMALTPGGIDLNTQDMGMTVTKDVHGGVQVNFDPALLARIQKEGIQSLIPVIIQITPLADIHPLLGLPLN